MRGQVALVVLLLVLVVLLLVLVVLLLVLVVLLLVLVVLLLVLSSQGRSQWQCIFEWGTSLHQACPAS
jgi:hypothetical protein